MRALLGAAAVCVLLGVGWYMTYLKLDSARQTVEAGIVREATLKFALETKEEGWKRERELLTAYQEVKKEIVYVDREVTKEVIRYRDRVVTRTVMPPEWVHAYNLSTRSPGLPNAPAGADGSAGAPAKTVDDAQALEVATSNNRSCVATIEQLKMLQTWAAGINNKVVPTKSN